MPTRARTIASLDPGDAWELAEGATMRLPRTRAAAIVRVERGTVLVTQAGDLEDHVLEPGDEIVLEPERLAVAWAFTAAAITVREAAPATTSSLQPSSTP